MPRPVPGFIHPLAPTLVAEPPEGDAWIHEIKHDGYRTILVIDRGKATAYTRNGHDWTDRYPRIVRAAEKLACRSAVIDGELVIQDAEGRSDFEGLRAAIAREPHRLIFFAFDLLHLDGEDLRQRPLIERRAMLRRLLGRRKAHAPIQFSEHVVGSGGAFFAAVEGMGLEGIVSKRATSRYKSGPSRAWLKTKCWTVGEFVMLGTELDRDGAPMALLARESEREDGLVFAGAAFITLPNSLRDGFRKRCEKLSSDRPPIYALRRRRASWIKPELRLEVKHLRGAGFLRHATVRGYAE